MPPTRIRTDDDPELLERYRWFCEQAELALQAYPLRKADVTFKKNACWLAARAHFLLMDAYKAAHFEGARTEDAKIAATTAPAIMTFRPFRVNNPDNVESRWAARANEHFVTRLVCPILNSRLPELSESDRMAWLLNYLARLKAKSLTLFAAHAEQNLLQNAYDIDLEPIEAVTTSDLSQLSILMLVFDLLWRPHP